jgi:glutamine synthetase
MIALTASSVASYYRLKPHSWSSSYTWLAERDREATLRICPVVTLAGRDPARQYNIEFRAADATANPYLALGAIVRAGLAGIEAALPTPPLVTGDPSAMSDAERAAKWPRSRAWGQRKSAPATEPSIDAGRGLAGAGRDRQRGGRVADAACMRARL